MLFFIYGMLDAVTSPTTPARLSLCRARQSRSPRAPFFSVARYPSFFFFLPDRFPSLSSLRRPSRTAPPPRCPRPGCAFLHGDAGGRAVLSARHAFGCRHCLFSWRQRGNRRQAGQGSNSGGDPHHLTALASRTLVPLHRFDFLSLLDSPEARRFATHEKSQLDPPARFVHRRRLSFSSSGVFAAFFCRALFSP